MLCNSKSVPLALLAAMIPLAATALACGQASQRAVYVATNGNLEGSVTSYTFNPDNSLHFVAKYIIGTNCSGCNPVPGTNAYSISITPDGRYLGVSHTTALTTEQITILRANADATLSAFGIFQTPDSPLDLQWMSNQYLAVTKTSTAGANQVIVYQFNDAGTPTLTQIDAENTGSFTTSLALHPSGQYLYAQDSTGNTVTAFRINGNGTLTFINVYANGAYPLGLGISPDGSKLYSGGGISAGGHAVSGFLINSGDGTLTMIAGSPFISPGSSPKQVAVSSDNLLAFAAHGSDSSTRSFFINQSTGALTATGFSFAFGIQGSLGEIAVLDNLLLVCDRDTIGDGVKGLYSLTINPNGSFTQNGPIVDSQGTVGPNAVVGWKPLPAPCPPDITGNGTVDVNDLLAVIIGWGACPLPCPPYCAADVNHECAVDVNDLLAVINGWGPCP